MLLIKKFASIASLAFAMANDDVPQKTATRLYVASYGGSITSLNYLGRNFNSTPVVSQNSDCGPSPSWLVWEDDRRVLHCLDEGIDRPSGSLVSYSVDMNGLLVKLGKTSVPPNPVHGSLLGANKTAMVVSHYTQVLNRSGWEVSDLLGPVLYLLLT
jgi:6-phosphogluconolactonase (cycloisomerase 2 family)